MHAVTLGNVAEGFALLDGVHTMGVALGFCFDVDNLIFYGLTLVENVVEFAKVGGGHLYVAGNTLVGVVFLGNHEKGAVVFIYFSIAERTIARRKVAACGSEDLHITLGRLAGFIFGLRIRFGVGGGEGVVGGSGEIGGGLLSFLG